MLGFFDHRIHGIHGRISILHILLIEAVDLYFRTRWLVPPRQTKRKTGGTSPRVRLVFTAAFFSREAAKEHKGVGTGTSPRLFWRKVGTAVPAVLGLRHRFHGFSQIHFDPDDLQSSASCFFIENLAKRLMLFLISVYSVYSVVFAWFF